jgi:uncharacterized protein YuzE
MENIKLPAITHDVETDTFYIQVSLNKKYQTKRITVNVELDLDEEGNIVGIKILELGAEMPYHILSAQYNLTTDAAEKIFKLLAYKN